MTRVTSVAPFRMTRGTSDAPFRMTGCTSDAPFRMTGCTPGAPVSMPTKNGQFEYNMKVILPFQGLCGYEFLYLQTTDVSDLEYF